MTNQLTMSNEEIEIYIEETNLCEKYKEIVRYAIDNDIDLYWSISINCPYASYNQTKAIEHLIIKALKKVGEDNE